MKEKEIWKSYYDDGVIKEECPIKYGKLNGVATLYNKDGSIKEKRVYNNDMLMGNPFTGLSAEKIATNLGLILSGEEEWKLAKNESDYIYEIDEKTASILLFNSKL